MPDGLSILGSAKIPWPDDCTHVFRAGEGSRNLAWIPQSPEQWNLYAVGYREAGERLYQSWCTTGHDFLIYPIVFLFRHYTELRLKELLQAAFDLLDLPAEWKRIHRLDDLWDHLRPFLSRIEPEGSERDLDNAERLLRELAERDPISVEFRYPEDIKGKRHLADLACIDVVNFFNAMSQLSSLLDGASMAISVYLQDKRSFQEWG
jgi:hypothetical protein